MKKMIAVIALYVVAGITSACSAEDMTLEEAVKAWSFMKGTNVNGDSASSESVSFEIVGTSPMEVNDKVETADDIRRGDIVGFERLSANTVVMRTLSQEEADEWPSQRYRIDQGSTPGVIQLTEITD